MSGAFVEDTIELLAFYGDSLDQPIGAPRPDVEWSSTDPRIVQVVSDSLAVAVDTGHATLRAIAGPPVQDTLDVDIEVLPRWSARLVWARHPSEEANAGVGLLELPGHEVRQLPDLGYPGTASGDPYLTSDGRRLAATARRMGSPGSDYTLYIVDLLTGVKSAPLDTVPGNQFSAAWFPGDTALAFLMDAGTGVEIFTARVDGSNRLQRTSLGARTPPFFDLTPDGHAVISLQSGSGIDLFEVALTGDSISRLTSTPDQEDHFPAVSPDGSMIAYVSVNLSDGRGHVWIVDRDGSNRRPLLPLHAKVTAFSAAAPLDTAQSHDPSWTADSRFVLVSWFLDPYLASNGQQYLVGGEIYAIRVADGLAVRLTRSPYTDRQPFVR